MRKILEVLLYPPPHNPIAMGSLTFDTIKLYLTTIFEKYYCNFNEFVRGINKIYLIELICSMLTEGKWSPEGIYDKDTPCFNKSVCPVDLIIDYGMFMEKGFFGQTHKLKYENGF